MNNLKNKLKKNGGFTLIEMLIVVAIIAILIAVSIPLVGNALERAREATDAANERAFKAELLIKYLNADGEGALTTGKVYAYDAAKGSVIDTEPSTGYGQGTTAGKDTTAAKTGWVLFGGVNEKGEVSMWWGAKAAPASSWPTSITENLTGPKLQGTT